jgi:excisionase family DNA binding protein
LLRYRDLLYDTAVILEDYATVIEASEVLCVHPETIKRLCRQGEIAANKLGNTWLIDRKTLAIFAVDYDSHVGRPKRSV